MRVCLFCLMALLTSWGVAAQEDPVVAEGAWGKITQAELLCARQASPEGTTDEALIEQIARDGLGAQKATELGLQNEALVRWRLWMVEQGLGGKPLYENLIASTVSVTTEELHKAYDERLSKYVTPGNFSFRYIFSDTTECKSPAEVEAVRAKIQQAHKELLADLGTEPQRPWIVETDRFVEVAKKYSDVKGDPGRVAGPFKLNEPLQPIIKNTALSLKVNEISPVFSTRYGFEIVRLENRVRDTTMEFEKAVSSLRQELDNANKMRRAKDFIQSLQDDKSRYDIFEDSLVQLLPGAHLEVPSATSVVRVGKTYYSREQLQEFLDNICKREWVRAKEKKEAAALVWRAFVLPQILHEEAVKAGYINSVTEQARACFERNSVLAGAWLSTELNRLTSAMPKPTTDEVRAVYEKGKDKYRITDRYLMTIISFPMEELKQKDVNRAQIEFLYREGEKQLAGILAQVTQGASPEVLVKVTESEKRPLKIETKWLAKGIGFDVNTWESLQTLMPGSWTPKPLRTDKGVDLVKVVQLEPERVKTFEEMFQPLFRQIVSERSQDTRKDLIKKITDEAMATLKKP